MTEAEWLEGDSSLNVSFLLQEKASQRKLRLFGCACCRRVWERLPGEGSRQAVELAELYADKLIKRKELKEEVSACWDTVTDLMHDPGMAVVEVSIRKAALWSSYNARVRVAGTGVQPVSQIREYVATMDREGARQGELLRDIFSNPFRSASVEPSWLTPTVATLALAAYEERLLPGGQLDPARLAVLADALEEAGCTDEAILAHLRSSGPHVRGCWALDLILGKQ